MDNEPQSQLIDIHAKAADTNNQIIELSEELGVRSYIFAPCIVCKFGSTTTSDTLSPS